MCNETEIPEFLEFAYGRDCDITCTLPARSYPTRFYQRAHPTHIYMSHMFQVLKNPPEYTMQYSVQPGRSTKNWAHAHLLGNAWQLHEFHANPSQNFTPYNSQSVGLESQLTLPKSIGNNTIFLFQKVWHLFPGLHLPGSMHSQEHQGCIRLNWWLTIKIHIINSQGLHNLKYKVFAFDRNLHLLVPNSLWPVQSILASLDHCNQASLFCNIQLTEQTSQTNQLTYWRRELKVVSPKILQD